MDIWKLGCNWGAGKPYFDDLLRNEKIVFCWEHNFKIGDFVIISKGHEIIAFTKIISTKRPVTTVPKYESQFIQNSIDYIDEVNFCKVEWTDLHKNDFFKYKLQQGICQVQKLEIIKKVQELIENYNERENIVLKLQTFYESNGIVSTTIIEDFNCSNFIKCSKCAEINKRTLKYLGAQAHVGSNYGKLLKVLVLSLDQGGGTSEIKDRTDNIESIKYLDPKTNSHMKGTIEFLKIIFENENDNFVLSHFAMTNSVKCSHSTDKLPTEIYLNCRYIHSEEILLLNPDIILVEGRDAIPDHATLNIMKIDENYIVSFIKDYLNVSNKFITKSIINIANKHIKYFGNEKKVFIEAPHPSARAGQWQIFRDISLPIIKSFIDFEFKKGILNK